MRTPGFLLLLFALPAAAQSFHWGFLGGTVLQTPYFPQISESVAFTPGALVEFRLPGRFALEANALYRRQGYSAPFQLDPDRDDVVGGITSRSNVLDVPLLVKYRHPVLDFVNVFVTSGYVRRWRSESFRISGARGSDVPVPSVPSERTTQGGFAIGGGVELDGGTLRMAIGYRYSRLGEFRSDKSHDLLVSFIFLFAYARKIGSAFAVRFRSSASSAAPSFGSSEAARSIARSNRRSSPGGIAAVTS